VLRPPLESAQYTSWAFTRRALDSGLTGGGEPIRVCTADEHRAGAKRQRLDDVAAVTDAAIDQHVNPIADGRHHFGKRPNAPWDAVELPAAVIGDHERVRPLVHDSTRVFRGVHALDEDLAVPQLADPFEIVPAHDRLFECLADIRVRHWSRWEHHVRKFHEAAVGEHARDPAGAGDHLSEVRNA